jgi:hypothetical protein
MKELFVVEVAYPFTLAASLGVWWLATTVPPLAAARSTQWWCSRRRPRSVPRPAPVAITPW